MLLYASKYSFDKLINMLLGHTVHFESDCMLFPTQGINGKVISYKIVNNELVFKIKRQNGKLYDIGSNTHNLRFEII
jgi:hypothetical protein